MEVPFIAYLVASVMDEIQMFYDVLIDGMKIKMKESLVGIRNNI